LKFFLHPKSHHKKFSFGKRLRRKKIESAHTGISGGLLLLWYCYQILLFWFDPHIAFFSAASSRGCLKRHFFRVLLYTQNISMSQVEINLVFQHVLLSRTIQLPIQKNLSVFTHQASLLRLIASSFTGFGVCALKHRCWWWWDTQQTSTWIFGTTSPTNNETRFNNRYTDLVFHDVHEKKYLVKLDNSHWWFSTWSSVLVVMIQKMTCRQLLCNFVSFISSSLVMVNLMYLNGSNLCV
jgi:hypothetical protein